LGEDKASIEAQIANIEDDINNRAIPKPGLKRLLAIVGFVVGIFCLLIPFSILVSFLASPSIFLDAELSGLFFWLFSQVFLERLVLLLAGP
jgi:hypothetical protein